MRLIMKRLLNNKEDFDNWCENIAPDNIFTYDEDIPNNYPCVVVFTYIDETDRIYSDVYYEFVYLSDFI